MTCVVSEVTPHVIDIMFRVFEEFIRLRLYIAMDRKIIILGARGSLEAAGSLMLFLAVKQMANLREKA